MRMSDAETMSKNPDSFYRTGQAKERSNSLVEEIFKKWIAANAKGPDILDSGCGDGSITADLAKRFTVTGIDISEQNLKKARQLGFRTLKQDLGKRMPVKDRSFDTVISNQVIEHIYDTDFYLEDIYRALKPGGILIVTTPNAVSLSDRLRALLGKLPIAAEVSTRYRLRDSHPPAGHIRIYTFEQLRHQLQRTGFRVIEESTTNFPFPIYWGLPGALKRLAIKLGRLKPSFGGQIMMRAVKPQ